MNNHAFNRNILKIIRIVLIYTFDRSIGAGMINPMLSNMMGTGKSATSNLSDSGQVWELLRTNQSSVNRNVYFLVLKAIRTLECC